MNKGLDHIPEEIRDTAVRIANNESFSTPYLFYKYDSSKPYSQPLVKFVTDKENMDEVWSFSERNKLSTVLFYKVCETIIFWEERGKIPPKELEEDYREALLRLSKLDASLAKSDMTHFCFEHAFLSALKLQVGDIDIKNKYPFRSVIIGMKSYFEDIEEHLDFKADIGLPRKIKSATAQRTYLAKELVQCMKGYLGSPNYGIVCKVCNVMFTEPEYEYLTEDHVAKLCKESDSKKEDCV